MIVAQESLSTVFGSKTVKDEPASPFQVMSLSTAASNPLVKAVDIGVPLVKAVPHSRESTIDSLPELYIDRLLSDRPRSQRLNRETFPFKVLSLSLLSFEP
jgi:hypothetical protein